VLAAAPLGRTPILCNAGDPGSQQGGVSVKYIFDLYWFNSGGSTALNLQPADYQAVPQGGWGNWTPTHNVDWMKSRIALSEDFMLVGDILTLKGQATNAGNGQTRCMVGAEVLLLLSAGYKVGIPPHPRQNQCLCLFQAPKNPVPVDPILEADAKQHLVSNTAAGNFWTVRGRKAQYTQMLQILG
jgi:hypothetical protein